MFTYLPFHLYRRQAPNRHPGINVSEERRGARQVLLERQGRGRWRPG